MWCADRPIDFIETAGDDPWIYSVNIFDPHPPYATPSTYLNRYRERFDDLSGPNYTESALENKPQFQQEKHEGTNNRGGPSCVDLERTDHLMIRVAYFAMCDLIDDAVARLLAALKRTDQCKDTLVLFMSDYGTMLGDHGLYMKGPYFYEEAVQVPLIIDGPAIEDGPAISIIVELVDIAPTLLAAVDESTYPGMQGESLWSHLQNEGSYTKEPPYCEFYNASTQHPDLKAYVTMIRSDRSKLVTVHGQSGGELYDLQEERQERTNHWSDRDYQAKKVRLLNRLTEWMVRTTYPLPECQAPW